MKTTKLIECALPLESINYHSSREKNIRSGHPSTLHLWWSRKPLAVCRALIFACLVDDPSSRPDLYPTLREQDEAREELFQIIEEIVQWENTGNQVVFKRAYNVISKHLGGEVPPIIDPFCGGGSIPMEAARLNLSAIAGDINPVAAMITRMSIKIAQPYSGHKSPNQASEQFIQKSPSNFKGLATDICHYGQWLREQANQMIGTYYPMIALPELDGSASVIAWLWSRTVDCPNPGCQGMVPLVTKTTLSSKLTNKYHFRIQPLSAGKTTFTIHKGEPVTGGTISRNGAVCPHCQTALKFEYIREESCAGRMHAQLIAQVAEGKKGRVYLPPDPEHEVVALSVPDVRAPETELPKKALGFRVQLYGWKRHSELFTRRQLMALCTLSDLLPSVQEKIIADYKSSDHFEGNCEGLKQYSEAITTYLAFAIDKSADYWSGLCTWNAVTESMGHTFTRQTLSMVWDYAECNPFSNSTGNFLSAVEWVAKAVLNLPEYAASTIEQLSALEKLPGTGLGVICTDPPYYDNIGYSDLSDFFYIWMRRSLKNIFPDELSTILVPKHGELSADATKFGGNKEAAKEYFEKSLQSVFSNIMKRQHPDFPCAIFYAFKQTESLSKGSEHGKTDQGLRSSSGWETMLQALLKAGFCINGTWPVRSESSGRLRAIGSNALASSIVLVCRRRSQDAQTITRRQFFSELKVKLPGALRRLQQGKIAPVDLAQAAIGPGMSIFSQFKEVLDADGSKVTVRTALALINQVMDEVLSEFDSEYDADTRWAISWFEQFGFDDGTYGMAETLSKAKNTSVDGLVQSGIIKSAGGKVRLLTRGELGEDWSPLSDRRLTIWEATWNLAQRLEMKGIEATAKLTNELGPNAILARDLAYRLYNISDRNNWSNEAQALNALVSAWSEVKQRSVSQK